MDEAEQLWTTASATLRPQVQEAAWRTCFEAVVPVEATEDRLVLAVPSGLAKQRLEQRYIELLESAVAAAAGGAPRAISLVVQPRAEGEGADLTADELVGAARSDGRSGHDPFDDRGSAMAGSDRFGSGPALADGVAATATPPGEPVRGDLPLNERYTFEAFVMGASNKFAASAALSVAEQPAQSYNPLFIHGESGLGKTHLLHAIGLYVREHFPGKRVRYVSTETMMNEFVDALRFNTTSEFKSRYRSMDVLLVDDVQFLETRERIQEEFFHTFNHVYTAGGQIVITSDRHARALTTLEERLRSRFLSGLITEVQPPDLETRLAILRKKNDDQRSRVPEPVLELIATHFKNNIRELEGALVRVAAWASLNHEPASIELAQQALGGQLSGDELRPITPQLILETTAATFGLSVDDLRGPSRTRPLVTARQICMYVFRELTEFSYPAIGREFGGRDHTTVMHAVEKIRDQMSERRAIYDQVTDLITRVKNGG